MEAGGWDRRNHSCQAHQAMELWSRSDLWAPLTPHLVEHDNTCLGCSWTNGAGGSVCQHNGGKSSPFAQRATCPLRVSKGLPNALNELSANNTPVNLVCPFYRGETEAQRHACWKLLCESVAKLGVGRRSPDCKCLSLTTGPHSAKTRARWDSHRAIVLLAFIEVFAFPTACHHSLFAYRWCPGSAVWVCDRHPGTHNSGNDPPHGLGQGHLFCHSHSISKMGITLLAGMLGIQPGRYLQCLPMSDQIGNI